MPKGEGHRRTHKLKKLDVPHNGAADGGKKEVPHLFALKVEEEGNWTYDAVLAGHSVRAVIDSFASNNFMGIEVAKTLGVKIEKLNDVNVELGDNSLRPVHGKITAVLNIKGHLSTEEIYLIEMDDEENPPLLILGRKWLKEKNPNINWSNNNLEITRSDGTRFIISPRKKVRSAETPIIKPMSFKKLARVVKKGNCELFMARLTEEEHPLKVQSLNTNAKFKDMVIEFGDIFREELPEELPPSRGMDFEINLKPGESPPVRPVIRLSSKELKELKKQLQKYLEKGF